MIRKRERNGWNIKNWIVLLAQNVTCVNDKKNQRGDHGLTKVSDNKYEKSSSSTGISSQIPSKGSH